ncbi:E3 ubiquitin-protein ligase TRIP12-like isoform X2 [Coccinella septempunctata]|nr:E3 ubiquitin-protein ligase TRIP12-like isoform X2 [Coccinella septempunctata]
MLVRSYPDWMFWITSCPYHLSYKTKKLAFSVVALDRHRAFRAVMDYYKEYSDALIFDNRYPLIQMDRGLVLDEFREALLHTDSFSTWNVLFFGENGSGVGVKRELYSEVGKELQKEKYKLWTKSSVTRTGYIHSRELYPDFYMGNKKGKGVGFENASIEEKFHIIGQIMAKALMEGHLLDLPLSLPVFKWLLIEESQLTIYDLKHVSEELFKTLLPIKEMIQEEKRISNNQSLSPKTRNNLLKKLHDEWETVESYHLVFVVPNHDVELIPGGRDIVVTRHNAALYIEKIEKFLLHKGVEKAMVALRTGFHKMINLDYLQIFEPSELQSLICGEENDKYWTLPHLEINVELSGFGIDSPEVQQLFYILSTMSKERRQKFLEFVTACPRLPADGFAGLTPAFTVKRTTVYPFAQTCFHTLHLTVGISKEQLETFIEVALIHGVGYFGIV